MASPARPWRSLEQPEGFQQKRTPKPSSTKAHRFACEDVSTCFDQSLNSRSLPVLNYSSQCPIIVQISKCRVALTMLFAVHGSRFSTSLICAAWSQVDNSPITLSSATLEFPYLLPLIPLPQPPWLGAGARQAGSFHPSLFPVETR